MSAGSLWGYVCPSWCDEDVHNPCGVFLEGEFRGRLAEPVHKQVLGGIRSGLQELTVDVVAMASDERSPVVLVGMHEVATATDARALARMLLAAADLVDDITVRKG